MQQIRRNKRTGEVQEMRDGQWVTTSPGSAPASPAPVYSIQTKPGDPAKRFEAPRAAVGLQRDQIGVQADQRGLEETGLDIEAKRRAPAQQRWTNESDLRNKFDNSDEATAYRTILQPYTAAIQAADNQAGDLNLVYAFAKIMDPGSVVREGEQDMVRGTGGVAERARGYIAGIRGKGRLTPELRNDLLREIRTRASSAADAYNLKRQEYERLAASGQLEPANVVGAHPGQPFQQAEADWMGRPVRNLDGSQGAAPSKPATPQEMDAKIKSMVQAQVPASEILNYIYGVKGKVDENDTAILRAYDAALQGGQRAEIGVRTMPAESTALGIAKGALHPLDRAAEGLQNGVNAIFGTNFDGATQTTQDRAAYFAQNPTDQGAETFGRILGGTALTAPIGGPLTQGATSAMLMGDSRDAAGLAVDAGIGAAGGKLADWAVRGGAALIAPRIDDSVRLLHNEGANLTPMQVINGGRRNAQGRSVEQKMESLPGVGPRISEARDESMQGMMRAAGNRALGPIRQRLPDNLPDGHAISQHVEETISNEYNRILGQMTVRLDPTFATRMSALSQRAMQRMRPQDVQELGEFFQREVGGAFTPGGGQLTGRQYKMLDERLGDMAARYRANQQDPYARDIGGSLQQIQEQMRGLARRQNPRLAADLRRADQAWAQYRIVRTAAAKNTADGFPTPAQLGQAVRETDRTVGRGATSRGEAQMQDLSKAAQQVLPSSLANSGTADRWNLLSPSAWAAGYPASALYSPAAMRRFQNAMMLPRGPAANAVADTLRLIPSGPLGSAGLGALLAPSQR